MDDLARNGILHELHELRSDADAHPSLLRVFLPLAAHDRALDSGTLVVRGERGAGKTALFHFIRELEESGIPVPSIFPRVQSARWVEGFSEKGKFHPAPDVLDAWGVGVEDDALLRAFWLGHLVGRLSLIDGAPALPAAVGSIWSTRPRDPAVWVPVARSELAALTEWLDRFDDSPPGGTLVVVSYDHLDKIGLSRPDLRQKFASSLLAVWLSLSSRLSSVKGKIFLREDLYQGSLRSSADASKLTTRAVALRWSAEDLYRMLLRHLGASEMLRAWMEGEASSVLYHQNDPRIGHLPPGAFPEEGSGPSQRWLAERLAGPQMGTGIKKGYTHRWIPNHLQDGRGSIVPRSLLNLVAFSAEAALSRRARPGQTRVLHPTDLQGALEKASDYRVQELGEEHKVVGRMEALRGSTLLAARQDIVRRLGGMADVGDGLGLDGAAAFDELERIGVLTTREDGRIDVPDIYRFGFGIKRRGGVARPK